MLNQVLHEIKNAKYGINLNELSRKLDIDRSTLDGMIQFWVQKGRLVDDDVRDNSCTTDLTGNCGTSCAGPSNCSHIMEMPKSYSLKITKNRQ